jgi:hypothetical protein
MSITKDQKTVIILFLIFIIIGVAYKVYINEQYKATLKDSVIIVGEIERFERTRGATTVDVKYFYNGRQINGSFDTYQLDSLKENMKVRLMVSKKYPSKYIEYIGVYEK